MTHPAINTLLVIPNREWSLSLHGCLTSNGFAPVTTAATGDSALNLFYQVLPQLVLVDLHLPDGNVVELCAEMLAEQPAVKVVLVAEPGAEAPLAALHAGVVGCIGRNLPLAAWPGLLTYILNGGTAFNHHIVETVLAEARSAQKNQSLITIGLLQIDLTQRLVLYDGQRIQLPPREFALLTYLVHNADRAVTFDEFLNEAWGYDANEGTAAQVRLYVSRLRRRLEEDAQTPAFILTERSVGYRLDSSTLQRTPLRSKLHKQPPL